MARAQPRKKTTKRRITAKPTRKPPSKSPKTTKKTAIVTPPKARTTRSGKSAVVGQEDEPICISDTDESEADSADSSIITLATPHHWNPHPQVIPNLEEARQQPENEGQKPRRKQSFVVAINKKPDPAIQYISESEPVQRAAGPEEKEVGDDSLYWLVTPEPYIPEDKVGNDSDTTPMDVDEEHEDAGRHEEGEASALVLSTPKDMQIQTNLGRKDCTDRVRLPTMMKEDSSLEGKDDDQEQRRSITPLRSKLEDPQAQSFQVPEEELEACSHPALPGPIMMQQNSDIEDSGQHLLREPSLSTVPSGNSRQVQSEFENDAICNSLDMKKFEELETKNLRQTYQQRVLSPLNLSAPDDTQTEPDLEDKAREPDTVPIMIEEPHEEDTDRRRLSGSIPSILPTEELQVKSQAEFEDKAFGPSTVPMESKPEVLDTEQTQRSQRRSFSLALTLVAEDTQPDSDDLEEEAYYDDFPMEDALSAYEDTIGNKRRSSSVESLSMLQSPQSQPYLEEQACYDDLPMADASEAGDANETQQLEEGSSSASTSMLPGLPVQPDLEEMAVLDDFPAKDASDGKDSANQSQQGDSNPTSPLMLDDTQAQPDLEEKTSYDDVPMKDHSDDEDADQSMCSEEASLVLGDDSTQAKSDLSESIEAQAAGPMMMEEDSDAQGADSITPVKHDIQALPGLEERNDGYTLREDEGTGRHPEQDFFSHLRQPILKYMQARIESDHEDKPKACSFISPMIMEEGRAAKDLGRQQYVSEHTHAHLEPEDRFNGHPHPVQEDSKDEKTDAQAQSDPEDNGGGDTLPMEEESEEDDVDQSLSRETSSLTLVSSKNILAQVGSSLEGEDFLDVLPIDDSKPQNDDADLLPLQNANPTESIPEDAQAHSDAEKEAPGYIPTMKELSSIEEPEEVASDQLNRPSRSSTLSPVPEDIVALDILQDAELMAAAVAREKNKERIRLKALKDAEKRDIRRAKARARYWEKKREREANLLTQAHAQNEAPLPVPEASTQQASTNGLEVPDLTPAPSNPTIAPTAGTFSLKPPVSEPTPAPCSPIIAPTTSPSAGESSKTESAPPTKLSEPTPKPPRPRCPYDIQKDFKETKRKIEALYPPTSEYHALALSFHATLDAIHQRYQTYMRFESSSGPYDLHMRFAARDISLESLITMTYLAKAYSMHIEGSDSDDIANCIDGVEETGEVILEVLGGLVEEGFVPEEVDDAALVCESCLEVECRRKREIEMVAWVEEKRKWVEENVKREKAEKEEKAEEGNKTEEGKE